MKYFMGDTRLAGLERMMMDPSRRCGNDVPTPNPRGKKAPPDKPRSGKETK